METSIDQLLNDAYRLPQTRLELFVSLCALNHANVLLKDINHPKELQYYLIKGSVALLVQHLLGEKRCELYEEVVYMTNNNDCVYIRCYGYWFSFHQVTLDNLTNEQRDNITDNNFKWDGVRLQPISEKLYNTSLDLYMNGTDNEDVVIQKISEFL